MAITSALSQHAANVTTSVITLPAGVAAGDLLIALCASDQAAGAHTWPGDWTELVDSLGTGYSFTAGYKIAAGGETSVSVTHTTERSNHIAFRIPAAEWHGTTPPEISSTVTGSSANPDPPNLDPAGWATEDTYWFAVACVDDSVVVGPVVTWPTNYTLLQAENGTAASAAYAAAAIRDLSASAENPGAFTMQASETWGAWTIAVRGVVAGGGAALAGVVAGGSTVAGDLTVSPAAALAGVIGGSSSVSGDLSVSPAHPLAGVIAGVSGVSGNLLGAMAEPLPIFEAIPNCIVEIWGPVGTVAQWDEATWDNATWVEEDWVDITHLAQNVQFGWGADDPAQGILTQVAANAWVVHTYDPDRELDPSNTPTPLWVSLRPGIDVRVRYFDGIEGRILKDGVIDNITYSIETQRGQLRIVDRVSHMANAKIPAGTTGVPTTLRAAAKHLLALSQLTNITIYDEEPPLPDPAVGGAITEETSLWDWLNTLALDALWGVYIRPDESQHRGSIVIFVDFQTVTLTSVIVGGAQGIPIEDVRPEASLSGVVSRVTAFDDGAPTTPITVTSDDAVNKFGIVPYKRDRPVPDGTSWASFVLADRSGASLQYNLGTLRPVSSEQFLSLSDLGFLDEIQIKANNRDNGTDPIANPINVFVRVLGMHFEGNTRTGWSVRVVGYVATPNWT